MITSAQEATEWRSALARWQEPSEFRSSTDAMKAQTGTLDLIVRREFGFLREAWVLSRYVAAHAVTRVRLANPQERWPDGFIQIEDKVVAVEITETIEPGRKRNDEYRDGPFGAVEDDPVEDWAARADQIPDALDRSVRGKKRKGYSEPFKLLVYLNIDEWGIRQNEIRLIISQIKMEHAGSFEGLHILWKGRWY